MNNFSIVSICTIVTLALQAQLAHAGDAPSPWGQSLAVVAYQPPTVEDRSHQGITFDLALGVGSTSQEATTASGSFGLGLWVHRKASVTFRATAVASYTFVGGTAQFYPNRKMWVGVGAGQMRLTIDNPNPNGYSYYIEASGTAAVLRAGYNVYDHGRNAIYFSGDLIAGDIEGEAELVGTMNIGYQLL